MSSGSERRGIGYRWFFASILLGVMLFNLIDRDAARRIATATGDATPTVERDWTTTPDSVPTTVATEIWWAVGTRQYVGVGTVALP